MIDLICKVHVMLLLLVVVFLLHCRGWHKHCTLHVPESRPVFTTVNC